MLQDVTSPTMTILLMGEIAEEQAVSGQSEAAMRTLQAISDDGHRAFVSCDVAVARAGRGTGAEQGSGECGHEDDPARRHRRPR